MLLRDSMALLLLLLPTCVHMSRICKVSRAGACMDASSGVVYVALKLQLCDDGAVKASGPSMISRPYPLSITGRTDVLDNVSYSPVTHAGEDGEMRGIFSGALPCVDGDCSVRGSMVQPFYDTQIFELFSCSKVECNTGGGCHIEAMPQLSLQLKSDLTSFESFSWNFITGYSSSLSTLIQPVQVQQDPIVLQAYQAVRSGIAALEEDATADIFKSFVADVLAATSTEVVRTREVIAEWIYAQLSLESRAAGSRKELCHWFLSFLGPDAYDLGRSLEYRRPSVCSKKLDEPHNIMCAAISKAISGRKNEFQAVSPFFKRDVRTKGLMQGHKCARVVKGARGTVMTRMRILVVGAGPVGLLTAIYERLSCLQCNYMADVEVIEKYHDLATRTNVVHLTATSVKMLESIGALSLMTLHQKSLLMGSDKSISISQLQRVLWRVAGLAGIRVRRGVEFLAYCPPVDDGSWFAVVKKHEPKSELDHVRRSEWAAGYPPDDASWRAPWLQRLCNEAHEDAIIEFDAIVAADGPGSLVRDQARHFSESPVYGETLSPVVMKHFPTSAYGVTINYKPLSRLAWDGRGFMRNQCHTSSAGDRHGYTFMSEHWCYHALLLFEKNETDARQLHEGLPRSIQQQVEFSSQFVPKSHLLYNARHVPDISVFKIGFQYVEGDAAAHAMMSRKGKPMLLLVIGDSFVPGFFPLANGVNKGFARIKKLNSVEGMAKLVSSGHSITNFRAWAEAYNNALKATLKGSDQAKSGLRDFGNREENRRNGGAR